MCVCVCVCLDVIDQEISVAGVRACLCVCLDVIDQEIMCACVFVCVSRRYRPRDEGGRGACVCIVGLEAAVIIFASGSVRALIGARQCESARRDVSGQGMRATGVYTYEG